jgi:hypothetical protein
MYNGYIIKKRSASTLLLATSTVRVVVVNVVYLCEPPFCLRRRRVVFSFSRTFFRKKYAHTSRTIPFRTSRRISRNVSMIITSFPKKERRSTTNHPHNFSCTSILSFITTLTIYQSSTNIGS